MGSSQSSHAETNTSSSEVKGSSVRGRKIMEKNVAIESVDDSIAPNVGVTTEVEAIASMEEATDEEEESSDDDFSSDEEEEEDKEYDEFIAERIRILDDARNLKKLADAFLHPEAPVHADPETFGRNYFTRASAPEQESEEESEERAQIIADAAALKKLAADYLHPEVPVVTTDANACGRNYFTRASAPQQESFEDAEERAQILAETAALKKLAADYLHPEAPVVTSDPTACGRNYFTRASAPEQESFEDAEERAQILAETAALKKLAADYLHPEAPVVTSDPTACGRNYFTRASAPEQESFEDAEERAQILAETAALKKLAADYLHPEAPVVTSDPTACGRNYFTRASAPEQESFEDAEERAQILAETAALKKLAADYLHPEVPVVTSDATACGRNYFTRASAPEQESFEDAEERAQILAETAALKKLAADYLHPEAPVVTLDPTACGRNYFTRASAPEEESFEDAEERAQILAETAALKKLAADYLHPEAPVVTSDPTACGRNYFTRASAPEQESFEDAEERAQILAETAALKKLAADYLHPEVSVVTSDATACGRNYFTRASAPEQESFEDAEERAQILAETAALKKLAADYLHPEVSVVTSDATACGRNYFTRASAPEQESFEDAEERAQILAETAALKKLAADYLHPEVPVVTSDATACGRNYFTRASAPEQESFEDAEERAQILAETAALKKLAADYLHPEAPVVTLDPTACGRNYFTRASAPQVVSEKVEDAGYEQITLGEEVREQLQDVNKPTAADKNRKLTADQDSDEGSMSRSPSSVMLFGLENQAF